MVRRVLAEIPHIITLVLLPTPLPSDSSSPHFLPLPPTPLPPGIAFALNDVLRDRFCSDPAHPSMPEKFLLGGLAGAVAMTAVYPM